MVIEMRRAAWIVPALALALCGCTAAAHRPTGTSLDILAVQPNVGRAAFHLRCDPPRGNLPDNAAACAALREEPSLVTNPKTFNCAGGTTSWWDLVLTGSVDGRGIHRTISTCWTPQMAMIDRLGLGSSKVLSSHLLPRQKAIVFAESDRTFAPGELKPGDAILCNIRGHGLELGVPLPSSPLGSVGYSGANIVPVTLELARGRDGALTASCHDGDPSPGQYAFR